MSQLWEKQWMTEMRDRLCDITGKCRNDMHEPDEQGISAIMTGHLFDNACGDQPMDNCSEMTIGLRNREGRTEWFNLASLIALARKAQI